MSALLRVQPVAEAVGEGNFANNNGNGERIVLTLYPRTVKCARACAAILSDMILRKGKVLYRMANFVELCGTFDRGSRRL